MSNSSLLAILVLALAILCAWAVVHFGRQAGQPERKLRRLRWGFLIGGVVCATYTFVVDSGLRRTTLYEELLEGSSGATTAVQRVATFTIEHAAVEHSLLVVPLPATLEEAVLPVHLQLRLTGPRGETWIEERRRFEMRTDSGPRPYGPGRRVWESHSFAFTPAEIGPARLEIVLEESGIHRVHVRVEDPEKTDGVRAPGY